MGSMRKRYDGVFKARIALLALKGEQTIAEIASQYSVHPNQVTLWKKQALEGLPEVFSDRRKKREESRDEVEGELYLDPL